MLLPCSRSWPWIDWALRKVFSPSRKAATASRWGPMRRGVLLMTGPRSGSSSSVLVVVAAVHRVAVSLVDVVDVVAMDHRRVAAVLGVLVRVVSLRHLVPAAGG